MTDEQEQPEFSSLPLNVQWLEQAPEHVQQMGHDILSYFNPAMMYLHQLKHLDMDVMAQGALLIGLSQTFVKTSMAMATMETFKQKDELGIDQDIAIDIQRQLFAAVLLMGIRYGQNNPEAFAAGAEEDLTPGAIGDMIQALIDALPQTQQGEQETREDD